MSRADLQDRASDLRTRRIPYVHARVVLAQRPTSAKPGDEAIIFADGSMEGFVGGSCAESTVRAQSLTLLATRAPLLLRITPTEEEQLAHSNHHQQDGSLTVHNPCLSGGTLEIFLEPVVPAPLVQVHGTGPIAGALSTLGAAMDLIMAPVDRAAMIGAQAVVVASHGRDELQVLSQALDAGVPYVGLVASRRRGAAVLDELAAARPDLAIQARSQVHTPAGLDIGAHTAPEVALSILAEIISTRPASKPGMSERVDEQHPGSVEDERVAAPALTAIDPVCGMTVAAIESSLQLDHDGTRYYFCGPGCLAAFSAERADRSDPASHLTT
jgi:xanthine dehydrogenase accessory factor